MAKKQKHDKVVVPVDEDTSTAPDVAALDTYVPVPYPKALYRTSKTPETAYETVLVGDSDEHAAHAEDGWVDHPDDLTE